MTQSSPRPTRLSGLVILGFCAAVMVTPARAQSAAPAPAPAAEPAPTECFYSRNINGWREVDDRTLNLRIGVSSVYQVKLLAACRDLKWVEAIGLEHRGSDWICSGVDVTVLVNAHGMRDRCPGISLRKLSQAEVEALPKGQKP